MRNWIGRFSVGVLLLVAPGTALAWNEAVDGDLSTNPSSPTPITFNVGNNTIAGTVTSGSPVDTRDYITFAILPGQRLTALRLITWQDLPGGGPANRGFHAINAGATSFVPDGTTEGNFLGGDHVDPAPSGTNLLPELSDGDTAGVGFTVPLGPGTYSYLIQQTGPQLNGYNLEFEVSALQNVPASSPWVSAVLAGLLAAIGFALIRKQALRPA